MNASRGSTMFFVHVPKTAGSSVNEILSGSGMVGKANIEQELAADIDTKREAWEDNEWLSGHVYYDRAVLEMSQLGISPRFFACIRDPTEHIVSHVNWLLEIQCRGLDFFFDHPKIIQLISFQTHMVDFTDRNSVCDLLMRHAYLFLNYQTRFVVGDDHEGIDKVERDRRIASYEFIGSSANIIELVERMGVSGVKTSPRVNVSNRHFDPEIFYDPWVQQFLGQANSRDSDLIAQVEKEFGTSLD